MASQSAIAEGGGVVTSDQINYAQKLYSHATYRHEPQFSNTFGQTVNVNASQIPVTVNIPPVVFNWSESYLNYTVYIPAGGANNYTWIAQQALKEISHIQFYAGSNMYIADIDNLQNYLDITIKKETELQDFMELSALTGISISNNDRNLVPALRNSTIRTDATVPNGVANPSVINYNEPAYFTVTAAANAATAYVVQFPMRLIKNSIFSIDKDVYFGQTTYLRMYFGPNTKICYTSDSALNPSAGAKANLAGTIQIGSQALNPNNVQPIQVQVMLAVEDNQDLRTMIVNQVASPSGLSYMIPYVQAFKNSNSGPSQNISMQFDQGNGRSLQKVYHAPYNQQEMLDTMYDHSNSGVIGGVYALTNYKIQQYYTQLNGKRNQDIAIDCTPTGPFLDYMIHKRQLRGSVLGHLGVYQYNWFHCDDFCNYGPKYDQNNNGELLAGIPMSVSPLTWSFVGYLMNGTQNTSQFQHYTWAVFTKKLLMTPGSVQVI